MIDALDEFLAALLRGQNPAWPPAGGELEFVAGLKDAARQKAAENALWERISYHGIALLVAEQLGQCAGFPPATAAKAQDEAKVQIFWEESHQSMLKKLFSALAKLEIPALLMKGSALAYSLYDNAATRRRGDSDVLINEADLGSTREALLQLGFTKRDDPHGIFFQESWLFDSGIGFVHSVDLHWQVNDSPLIQSVLKVEEYFARAEPLGQLHPHARAPYKVATFIQGAINQSWHSIHGYLVDDEKIRGGGRLIGAMDSHLLAEQFQFEDWQELLAISLRHGLASVMLEALILAKKSLGSAVPDDVLRQLQAAPQQSEITRHLHETNMIATFFTNLRAIPSLSGKCSFVLENALPAGEHLRQKYPQSSSWPLPLLHIRRMGEAAMRWRKAG